MINIFNRKGIEKNTLKHYTISSIKQHTGDKEMAKKRIMAGDLIVIKEAENAPVWIVKDEASGMFRIVRAIPKWKGQASLLVYPDEAKRPTVTQLHNHIKMLML
jgi:hypothetical protein